MSAEFLHPSQEVRVMEHEIPPETTAEKLARYIVSNEVARTVYDDFMWDYVGHPDPEQRDRGALDIDDRYHHLYSGFGEKGSLVHVRKSWHDYGADNYYVVLADVKAGSIREMHVSHADMTDNSGIYSMRLSLQDKKLRSNAPPGFYDHKPPRDRLRLRLDLHELADSPPELSHPSVFRRHETMTPIEKLSELIMAHDVHIKVQEEVERYGLMSVDTALTEVDESEECTAIAVNM